MSQVLQEMQTELNKLTTQLRNTVDEQGKDVTEFKNFSVDSKATLDKLNTRLTELETALNTKASVNNLETKDSKYSEEQLEYKNKFNTDYLKKGKYFDMDIKAMSTDDDTQGGMFVPKPMRDTVVEKLRDLSPIRSIAGHQTISVGSSYGVPVEGDPDMGSGWVGEREPRNDTDNPTLSLVEIPIHEQYVQPVATRRMLDDPEFDVEAWYNKKVSSKFARKEGNAFVNGNGVKKPTGLLQSTRVSKYEGTLSGTTQFDDMILMQSQIRQAYQLSASWLINRFTLAYLRTFKDQQGAYLWQPSLQPGVPATLLGKGYTLADDMPNAVDSTGALISGNVPIIYGSFEDGYLIVDKTSMVVIRDEITNKPFIKYYTTSRVGGDVIDDQALVKFELD